MLVVFGGMPGVGKTMLSRRAAERLAMTWLRIDAVEAAMWRAGLPPSAATGLGAYVVANAVASAQLGLGGSVVVDAVNPVEAARKGWRDLAMTHRVALRVIEVVCSDREEHRRRVRRREPDADQPSVPEWHDVLTMHYESWRESRLTVDTVADPDDCLAKILAYCRR